MSPHNNKSKHIKFLGRLARNKSLITDGNTVPAKPDCQSVQQMMVVLCHQFHETQLARIANEAEKTAEACQRLNASNLLQQSF